LVSNIAAAVAATIEHMAPSDSVGRMTGRRRDRLKASSGPRQHVLLRRRRLTPEQRLPQARGGKIEEGPNLFRQRAIHSVREAYRPRSGIVGLQQPS